MYERPRRRLNSLALLLVIFGLLLTSRLVSLQILNHARYLAEGKLGRTREREVAAKRGKVWDRNRNLLVANLVQYDIAASPNLIKDPDGVADTLASILDGDANRLSELLSGEDSYVIIERGVSKNIVDQIRAKNLVYLSLDPVWRRAYPEDTLAAHLLGFVNLEDQGYYGVEGFYNKELRGEKGHRSFQGDGWKGVIPLELADEEPANSGADLVLTLDRTIQAMAEQELSLALEETGAKSGVIIVMDPRTGAILAMTALPAYDPNHFWQVTNARVFANPAISGQYEPGSVFKVLTMAVALENGVVTPDTTFYDAGYVEVGGQVISNALQQAYGNVTLTEVLVHSLNVEMAKISTMLGPTKFYEGIRAFGIGHRTGIDLEGEAIGNLRVPGDWDWHESDLATHSFGQGLAVTPLQMITAVAAIANKGLLTKPYVVAEKIFPDGRVERAQPAPIGWAVSPETARLVTEMMAQTVEQGIKLAHVPGYQIAGKTGTAQMPTPFGYDEQKTIASFVGFAPVEDPEVIILVRLDEPTSSEWGARTAAPAFARLAQRLFVLLEIPPDDIRQEMRQMASR